MNTNIMQGLGLAFALFLSAVSARAANTIITREIANAPGWQAEHAYRTDYQAVQAAAVAAGGAGCADNDIVTLRGGTGIDPAKLYLTVHGGDVTVSAIGPAGAYSAVPPNPVSATGGSCRGLTLNITWTGIPSRVLAGPGWTPGAPGSFINGRPLYLWQATSTGTSGKTAPNLAGSCAAGAAVTDGGVTWKCVTIVDYNTITGFLWDNRAWQPNAAYFAYDNIVNAGRSYILAWGTSQSLDKPPFTCKSASSGGPTGTGLNIRDGECAWTYIADVGANGTYTSRKSYIPTDIYFAGGGHPATGISDYHTGRIWYGGAAQQEYVGGSGGETDPVTVSNRYSNTNSIYNKGEVHVVCGDDHAKQAWSSAVPGNACAGTIAQFPEALAGGYQITLEASAADRFNNHPQIRNYPLIYNAANGVAIHGVTAASNPYNFSGNGGGLHGGDALSVGFNNSVTAAYLQLKADHGSGFDGEPNGNGTCVYDSLIDATGWGTGSPWVVTQDGGGCTLQNIIIARGNNLTAALYYHYVPSPVNNTIVALGTAPACMYTFATMALGGPATYIGNYCAGFTHQATADIWVSELTESITSATTQIRSTQRQPLHAPYFIVDQEQMDCPYVPGKPEKCSGSNGNEVLDVVRGFGGSTATAHAKGAIVANNWPPFTLSTSKHNAVSNALATSASLYKGYIQGYMGTLGAINYPGVGNTCGAGNTGTCYGRAGSVELMNPYGDFRLKPTSNLRGAGTQASYHCAGKLVEADCRTGSVWTNDHDITGVARPTGAYDIGAFQTTGERSPGRTPAGKANTR
jgi:hypothetical protein